MLYLCLFVFIDPLSGVLMFGTNFVACNFMNDIDKYVLSLLYER